MKPCRLPTNHLSTTTLARSSAFYRPSLHLRVSMSAGNNQPDQAGGSARYSTRSNSATLTGFNIRARVSQQAGQVGTREYWSAIKAGAKQKAAEVSNKVGQWVDEREEAWQHEQEEAQHRQSLSSGASGLPEQLESSTEDSSTSKRPKFRQAMSSSAVPTSVNNAGKDIVHPVLLPGYTFTRLDPSDERDLELYVVVRGFVSRRPTIQGRSQRMFNLMARQLARLPKPLSASSTSLLLNPHPTSTEDATYFPAIPSGGYRDGALVSSHGEVPANGPILAAPEPTSPLLTERIVEKAAEKLDSEVLGKLVSKLGVLPIDGGGGVHEETQEIKTQEQPDSTPPSGTSTPAQRAPRGIGGSGSRAASTTETSPTHIERDPSSVSLGRMTRPSSTRSSTATSTTAVDTDASAASSTSRLSRLKGLAGSRSTTSLASSSGNPIDAANLQLVGGSQSWGKHTLEEIQQLTQNLNERLADFWIYRVAHRKVRVDVQGDFEVVDEAGQAEGREWTTLLAQEMTSDSNGMFRLRVNMGNLSFFGDRLKRLRCRAVLLDETHSSASGPSESAAKDPASTGWCPLDLANTPIKSPQVRVISDIDDTIRKTNVIMGLKSVFRQVFVLPHNEVTVSGVADWYHSLLNAGIGGLHYVSNAPIELWRPIREYLEHAGMPHGHLHLKSYNSELEGATSNTFDTMPTTGGGASTQAGRSANSNSASAKTSLLSSWLQPASARKRAALTSILDDFPESQFILIGDSGELDLELYSELAKERPRQIRALYIRDVSGVGALDQDSSQLQLQADGSVVVVPSQPLGYRARVAGQIKRPVRSLTDSSNFSGRSRSTSPIQSRKSSPVRAPQDLKPLAPVVPPSDQQQEQDPPPIAASFSPLSTHHTHRAPSLQARILKAQAILPETTELHLWKKGEDVQSGCEELVKKLLAS